MEVFNYVTKKTQEEIARKERTKALMKELNIKDMDDIQDLFKSFVAAALEGGLEAELDEELGYSKYDYRNKETNNSRNGYSKKTMKTNLCPKSLIIFMVSYLRISSSF